MYDKKHQINTRISLQLHWFLSGLQLALPKILNMQRYQESASHSNRTYPFFGFIYLHHKII